MDLRQYTLETLHQGGEAVNSTTRQVSPTALSYLQGKHKVSSQTVGAGHSVGRVQDGYFGGRLLDITQTTDGYLWAGTEAGLFKFDGVRFVRWTAQSGEELPSSRILSLLAPEMEACGSERMPA